MILKVLTDEGWIFHEGEEVLINHKSKDCDVTVYPELKSRVYIDTDSAQGSDDGVAKYKTDRDYVVASLKGSDIQEISVYFHVGFLLSASGQTIECFR